MPGFTWAAPSGLFRFTFFLLLALALPADASQRNLRFERLSVEEGLSQHSVMSILQDRQGFIWFGTQAGLHRYDGYRIVIYRNDSKDPDSIPDNFISASYEDPAGRLWFGTKGGLARHDPATGRFERFALTQPGRTVKRSVGAIVPGPDGALWLATNDGVVRFDPAHGPATLPCDRPGQRGQPA